MIDWVVDTGVAIKWYVPEIHDDKAKNLLSEEYTLHVPELFFVEFGNIVWKKTRIRTPQEMTIEEGREVLRRLLDVALIIHPMRQLLEPAFELAVGPERPTVYDATYLALARSLDCRLATADRKLFDAYQGGPLGASLVWVADLP